MAGHPSKKATDEAAWSELYAWLCRKLMERISSRVQDDVIENNERKPISYFLPGGFQAWAGCEGGCRCD